jgi:alpha-1,3-glucosyltransferase
VHEKAILLVIIPFSLIALNDRRHLGAFRPLAVAGHVSLFPLLFTASEFPVKVAYTIFWLMAFLLAFDRLAPALVLPSLLCSSPYTQPALKMIYHSNFTN